MASTPTNMSMNGRRQSSTAESPADTAVNGRKRKSDEMAAGSGSVNGGNGSSNGTTGQHTRAKRNRYISIACNECKRRKIKCNGNTPCQRCGNLNLECQYAPNCCANGFKDSEEFRQMNAQIQNLQEQVDNLYAGLNALRAGGDAVNFVPPSERSMSSMSMRAAPISPINRFRPTSRHPSFRGPSSSAFGLDVAKNTLHSMGYQNIGGDEGITTQEPTPIGSPPQQLPPINHPVQGRSPDPLTAINREETNRLCRVYEEEMGLMYPVVDIEYLMIHAKNMHDFLESALRTGLAKVTAPQGINGEQSLVLKMVLACTSVTEGNGQSEIASRLYESVREAADRALHSEVVELKTLPFLVLVAIYHFHCDEEALAWRIIGQVARMCIELGLHRRDSLFKVVPDEEERTAIINLFWSVYVLDRRWSFGVGLPFALQDADIDPNLPEPTLAIPYLNVMITYSRIGSKVWRSISSYSSSTPTLNIEEIGYLDYQILQWQKSIPPSLSLPLASAPQPPASRAIHRLQILLYLRANQMRILIYRPVLHSASSIQEHPSYASTVIELAKDTIRALTHLDQTTDIYRVQQVCFNYFLISALAVLFLASCHAPVTFSGRCRDEFYMALDLVKGMREKSFVAKRLWRTIKGLKEVGPRLGLTALGPDGDGEQERAALAMAGLAGHEIEGYGGGVDGQGGNGNGNSPMNGFRMSSEMTSLFEAALGVGHSAGGGGGYQVSLDEGVGVGGVGGVGSHAFGGDEELYRQLRDLF